MTNHTPNKSRRIGFGLARVLLLAVTGCILIFMLSFRATMARADDSLMGLGRHLVALSENGIASGERGLLVNGQSLGFRVFTIDQDMHSALDFYESWCHGNEGDFPGQERRLALLETSDIRVDEHLSRSWKDLVIRNAREGTGFVACLQHGDLDPTTEELGSRLRGFLSSGNLRELGQFHYASVTKVGDQTRVVTLWTEGDFFPLRMFPSQGDAPGFDLEGMSRPPSGRRLFSAGEYGHAATLSVYVDCEESVDSLSSFYRREFVGRRWRLLSDESQGKTDQQFLVQRGPEMRVIAISQERGEKATVTIAGAP